MPKDIPWSGLKVEWDQLKQDNTTEMDEDVENQVKQKLQENIDRAFQDRHEQLK